MKELKELKDQLDTMKHLQGTWEDIQVLIEMAHEENDESMVEEIEKEISQFEEALNLLGYRRCSRENMTHAMPL